MEVLIDTWWNVNEDKFKAQGSKLVVLIDTWWNVNEERQHIYHDFGQRFNRYMVECESTRTITAITTSDRFNRYMVECEF